MDKKGVLGLRTAIAFVLVLLTLVIVAFLSVLIYNTLLITSDNLAASQSLTRHNETLTTVDEIGENLALIGARDGATSGVIVTNASTGDIFTSGNYTITKCDSIVSTGGSAHINNTNWNITYTCTYIGSETATIMGNVSAGTVSLFSNATTWFALIGIVIIILIIAIVIVTVRGFEGSGTGRSTGEFQGL